MSRFYYFNKGYLHTVIRCLQGLDTIVHLYKIVTFTTLVRVLADDKDTAWNRHGYTSRVTGYTKEIHKEVEAKPEKVKAPSATPNQVSHLSLSMGLTNVRGVCMCVFTLTHRRENTSSLPK